ncbi:MAG: hypothetical protein Q9162_004574 [Coniocarpon cinnabarinum]
MRGAILELVQPFADTVMLWQVDMVVSYLNAMDDSLVERNTTHEYLGDFAIASHVVFQRQPQDDFTDDSTTSSSETLLSRCKQAQGELNKLKIQEQINDVKGYCRSKFHLLICKHLSELINQVSNKSADFTVSHDVVVNGAQESCFSISSQAPGKPQPTRNEDSDDHFNEFLRRQEEAMRFAFQASEQSEQSPGDDAKNHKDEARPEVGERRSEELATCETYRESPLHQPTPIAPVRLPQSPSIVSTATLRESYDSARLAAQNRALQRKRPPSPVFSNRRVWSTDEENALLEGLETLRGPHWRDILSLYGEHGTRSDVLKGRNQVQLKDKARNMKLFFVKHGMEVPEVLRNVTGELKKWRGGGFADTTIVETRHAENGAVAGSQLNAAEAAEQSTPNVDSNPDDPRMPPPHTTDATQPPDRGSLVEMATAVMT